VKKWVGGGMVRGREAREREKLNRVSFVRVCVTWLVILKVLSFLALY
jgi:hypothetical protein